MLAEPRESGGGSADALAVSDKAQLTCRSFCMSYPVSQQGKTGLCGKRRGWVSLSILQVRPGNPKQLWSVDHIGCERQAICFRTLIARLPEAPH